MGYTKALLDKIATQPTKFTTILIFTCCLYSPSSLTVKKTSKSGIPGVAVASCLSRNKYKKQLFLQ